MRSIVATLTLLTIASLSFSQVNLGVEVGAGMGTTKVKNVDQYPDMFKDAAGNGSLYTGVNVNIRASKRVQIKVGAGIKGQPYQFNVDSSYGLSEIQAAFGGGEDLSKIAASYYFPAVVKFKLLRKDSSPFFGLGYTWESLFNELKFEGIDGDEDFQYVKKNLSLLDLQFGYVIAKNGDPKIELIFSYEIGLNNLATESYSFLDDGFKIRENDLEFGIAWYFL